MDKVTGERDRLISEVEHLENINNQKLKLLEEIKCENTMLTEKLGNVKKIYELGDHFSRIFKCKKCDNKFGSQEDLKLHKRSNHGGGNSMDEMKLRLYEKSFR